MSDSSSVEVLEEKLNYKSITCFQIPEVFLDSKIAKEHFGQFGRIARFILRPSRFSCTVEYDSEQSAENAKNNGRTFKNYQFNIKFSPAEIAVKPKLIDPDPDVLDELTAMRGSATKAANKMPANPLEKFLKPHRTENRPPAAQYAYKSLTNRNPVIPNPMAVAVPQMPKHQYDLRSNSAAAQARADLDAVAARPAVTADDKFKVLDLRDKFLRHIMIRSTDIKKAQSTKGTCHDMCPEKERWMREAKSQIAAYEYLGDTSHIDHQLAVKQYSRSSADQETPMPHELRSEAGLKLTMLYLLHNIVGLCDDPKTNLSDWYHFVWDRTRSIRKDITQQELCSSDAVELIEKCTRFHIHCSARLIFEDASVFDHKINTENLTKCLQSLKYMYNDLELRGVHCRNEAEFRAYIILLNLNDGNFLWEIKQLPSAVFKSAPIRFALDVYFAIQNNNYVRFFQLVRDTTYMNACILLRYFNQVRCKALEVMVKAFASRMPVNFTISYFTELLAFEDAETACLFLEYLGLECSPSEDLVKLDRKMFEFPDMPFVLDRALRVVESKRTKSVGEAICGGPLAPLDEVYHHSVHSSFTAEGYLRQDAWLAEDQNGKLERSAMDLPDSRPKLMSPDDHVFKKPNISPPISPKTVISPKIVGRLGSRVEPVVKEKPIVFAKPPGETISGITPIFNNRTTPTTSQSSIFAPTPSIFTAPTTASIFGGAAAQMSAGNSSNIFASAFSKPAEPPASVFTPPVAGSIFGGQQFVSPTASRRDIFAPKVTTPTNLTPASVSPGFADTPSQPDSESLSDSGTESEKQAAPSPTWSRDSDDEDEDEEDESEADSYAVQQEAEMRRKLEEKLATEQRIAEKSDVIFQQLLDSITEETAHDTTTEFLGHYKALVAVPPRLFDDLLGELILDEVLDVALEETVRKQVNLKLMRRCFRQWRANARDAIERMQKIENTPCWLPRKSLREQAQELQHPSQNLNLFYMARYLKGSPVVLKYPTETVTPIDVFGIVAPQIFNQPPTQKLLGAAKSGQQFCKLTISTPFKNEENQSDFYNYVDKFLARAFRTDDQVTAACGAKRDIFYLQQRTMVEYRKTLAICVRQVRGRQLIDEFNQPGGECVANSNGLLFFMTALSQKEVTRERLHKCLATAERWGPCPLAILVYESSIEHITVAKLVDQLGLDELLDQEKITDYEIVFHSTQQKLQRSIEVGLEFLAKNYAAEHCLEMQSQISFLGMCLGEELWLRFAVAAEQNEAFASSATSPNFVVALYNQAVQRVINIVSHDFGPYQDFPDELRKFVAKRVYDIPVSVEFFAPDWKSKERQTKICDFLEQLKVPAMQTTTFATYQALDAEINRLAQQTLTDARTAARVANQMLHTLLKSVENLVNQPDTFGEGLEQIVWIPAIRILATEHLQEKWQLRNQQLPADIVYKKTELESYTRTPWWLADSKLAKWRPAPASDRNDEPERKRQRVQPTTSLSFTKDQLTAIMAQGEQCMRRANEKIDNIREVAAETKKASQHFDHIMYRQQKLFYENRRMWDEQMDI